MEAPDLLSQTESHLLPWSITDCTPAQFPGTGTKAQVRTATGICGLEGDSGLTTLRCRKKCLLEGFLQCQRRAWRQE